MANRLSRESSPYLLQHADNPVVVGATPGAPSRNPRSSGDVARWMGNRRQTSAGTSPARRR